MKSLSIALTFLSVFMFSGMGNAQTGKLKYPAPSSSDVAKPKEKETPVSPPETKEVKPVKGVVAFLLTGSYSPKLIIALLTYQFAVTFAITDVALDAEPAETVPLMKRFLNLPSPG